MAENEPSVFKPRPCPICSKMSVVKYRPFCSKRCSAVDLGRWLGEVYTVPVSQVDNEDGEDVPPGPASKGQDPDR